MSKTTDLSWDYIFDWISVESRKLVDAIDYKGVINIYGIPRGGTVLSGFFNHYFPNTFLNIVDPKIADVIIDDIVDSGRTKEKYTKINPTAKFISLIDKLNNENHKKLGYVNFPWESDKKDDYDDLIIRILQHRNETVSNFTIQMVKDAIDFTFEEK